MDRSYYNMLDESFGNKGFMQVIEKDDNGDYINLFVDGVQRELISYILKNYDHEKCKTTEQCKLCEFDKICKYSNNSDNLEERDLYLVCRRRFQEGTIQILSDVVYSNKTNKTVISYNFIYDDSKYCCQIDMLKDIKTFYYREEAQEMRDDLNNSIFNNDEGWIAIKVKDFIELFKKEGCKFKVVSQRDKKFRGGCIDCEEYDKCNCSGTIL